MPSGGKCTAMIETEMMWLQTELYMPLLIEAQPRYDNTDNHKIVNDIERLIIIDNMIILKTHYLNLPEIVRSTFPFITLNMGSSRSAARPPGVSTQHLCSRGASARAVSRHLGWAPPQLSVETRARRAELDGDWRHEHQVPHRPRSYGRRGTRGAVLLSSSISLLPLPLP